MVKNKWFDALSEVEKINVIHKLMYISAYPQPPYDAEDVHHMKNPWWKFGSVNGEDLLWRWYDPKVILERKQATEDEIDCVFEIMREYYGS